MAGRSAGRGGAAAGGSIGALATLSLLALSIEAPRPAGAAEIAGGIAARLEALERSLQAERTGERGARGVPLWVGGERFLYGEDGPEDLEVLEVDPRVNTVTRRFPAGRVRAALEARLGAGGADGARVVGEDGGGGRALVIEAAGHLYRIDAAGVSPAADLEAERAARAPRVLSDQRPTTFGPLVEVPAPDGRRFVSLLGDDLALRRAGEAQARRLTEGGTPRLSWRNTEESAQHFNVRWAPDARHFAAIELDTREVWYEPLPHWLGKHPSFEPVAYARAGEPMPRFRIVVFDADGGGPVPIATGDTTDHYVNLLGWRADGARLYYQSVDREQKTIRVYAADPRTGVATVLLEESSATYLDTPMTLGPAPFHPLAGDGGFLWLSARTGFRHIERYDRDGRRRRALTAGDWSVEEIVAIDEAAGRVYFRASLDPAHPYDLQLWSVSLAGGGRPVRLTSGSGYQEITFSPSLRYFLARGSTPESPPVVELRRADGRLLRVLSRARIEGLLAQGYGGIERFATPVDGGRWTMHGIIARPFHFDPARRYPVVEFLYGGMQLVETPPEFYGFGRISSSPVLHALLHGGSVVVIADAPGTPGRGQAFRDATYGTWPQGVIAHHAAWIEAAARSRPWMDLSRVGVYGHSWGGYMAERAMIEAPGLYRVAVAHAAPADFVDHPTYIEPFLGLPAHNPQGYAAGSNLARIGEIRGPVLVMPMPRDVNAGFTPGMKFLAAMIEARRDVDVFTVPEASHYLSCCGRALELYQTAYLVHYLEEHLR